MFRPVNRKSSGLLQKPLPYRQYFFGVFLKTEYFTYFCFTSSVKFILLVWVITFQNTVTGNKIVTVSVLCRVLGVYNPLRYKCWNKSVKVSQTEDRTNLGGSHEVSHCSCKSHCISDDLWLQSVIQNFWKSVVHAVFICSRGRIGLEVWGINLLQER